MKNRQLPHSAYPKPDASKRTVRSVDALAPRQRFFSFPAHFTLIPRGRRWGFWERHFPYFGRKAIGAAVLLGFTLFIVLPFMQGLVFGTQKSTTFYAQSCLGEWEKSSNAEGTPSLTEEADLLPGGSPDGDLNQFTKDNSATYQTGNKNIWCAKFVHNPADSFNSAKDKIVGARIGMSLAIGEQTNQIPVEPAAEDFQLQQEEPATIEVLQEQSAQEEDPPVIEQASEEEMQAEPGDAPIGEEVSVDTSIPAEQLPVSSVLTEEDMPATPEAASGVASEEAVASERAGEGGVEISQSEISTQEVSEALEANLDARLDISFSFDGTTWHSASTISSYPISNLQNGGYFSFPIPLRRWKDVDTIQVRVQGLVGGETLITAYLDSVWLEVDYHEPGIQDTLNATGRPKVRLHNPPDFIANKDRKKDFTVNDSPSFVIQNPYLALADIEELVSNSQAQVLEDRLGKLGRVIQAPPERAEEGDFQERSQDSPSQESVLIPELKQIIEQGIDFLRLEGAEGGLNFLSDLEGIAPASIVTPLEEEIVVPEETPATSQEAGDKGELGPEEAQGALPDSDPLESVQQETDPELPVSSIEGSDEQIGQSDSEQIKNPAQGEVSDESRNSSRSSKLTPTDSIANSSFLSSKFGDNSFRHGPAGVEKRYELFDGSKSSPGSHGDISFLTEPERREIDSRRHDDTAETMEIGPMAKESYQIVNEEATSSLNSKFQILNSPVAYAQSISSFEILRATLKDPLNNPTDIPFTIILSFDQFGNDQYEISFTPEHARQLYPGLYTLEVELQTDDAIIIAEQKFSWGVLVVNVNKSIYTTNDLEAHIQMGAVSSGGFTVCNADMELIITSPSGIPTFFSTTDNRGLTPVGGQFTVGVSDTPTAATTAGYGVINRSPLCAGDSYSPVPDYDAIYQLPAEPGRYQMELVAIIEDKEHTITDAFEVWGTDEFLQVLTAPSALGASETTLDAGAPTSPSEVGAPLQPSEVSTAFASNQPYFDIERFGPSRIYPPSPYEVKLKITPYQDFQGEVIETVPAGFVILKTEPPVGVSDTPTGAGFSSAAGEPSPGTAPPGASENNAASEVRTITWPVSWQAHQTYELSYVFKAPEISPYLYLLGPLELSQQSTISNKQPAPSVLEAVSGQPEAATAEAASRQQIAASRADFAEIRAWQIASDNPDTTGMLVYSGDGDTTPHFRTWSGTDLNAEQNLQAEEANHGEVERDILRCITTPRVECIYAAAGYDSTNAILDVQVWTPAGGWTDGGNAPTDGNFSTALHDIAAEEFYGAFDVGYEETTGHALVVYENTLTDNSTLAFRTWDGSNWSSEDTAYTYPAEANGDVRWIRMAPRPTTDDFLIAFSASDGDLYAVMWDGSAMDTTTDSNLTDSLEIASAIHRPFDVAWESQNSSTGLVVWGNSATTLLDFCIHTGATSTLCVNQDQAASELIQPGSAVMWLELAADFATDNIAMINSDTTATMDLVADLWDGADWNGTATEPTEETGVEEGAADDSTQVFDVAWERGGDRAIFAFIDVNAELVSFFVYDIGAGTWNCPITGSTITSLDAAQASSGPCVGSISYSGTSGVSEVSLHPSKQSDSNIMLIAYNNADTPYAPEAMLWTGGTNWTQTATMGAFEGDLSPDNPPAIAGTDNQPQAYAFDWLGAVDNPPMVADFSDTPDPVAAGSAVTFSVGWQDLDSSPSWTRQTAAAQWPARIAQSSVVFNDGTNQMWVIGGTTGTRLNDVWRSADGTTWTQATAGAQWSARNSQTSLFFNDGTNKMWVIGGNDNDGACVATTRCNDVWYSATGATWTQATAAAQWVAREGQASLVFTTPSASSTSMWVIGGTNGTNQNDVWYSTNGTTWTQQTIYAHWPARSAHTSLAFNNQMWIMGGTGAATYNDVWYSTNGTSWTQATAGAQWVAREDHTSLIFNNQMWVLGGFDVSIRYNDVWYSTSGASWTRQTAAAQWVAREDHTSLVFNNQMWVIGGTTGTNQNDVWYASGEQARIHICKTNVISATGAGGACDTSQTWVSSSSFATTDPRTEAYTTTTSDIGTKAYWVFACSEGDVPGCSGNTIGTLWKNALQRYDGTGTQDRAQWVARESHTSLVFNNQMWVAGGIGSGSVYRNDVWYSTNGVSWTSATTTAQWTARRSHTSLAFNNQIWVIGGTTGTNQNDVWYSATGTTWTQATAAAQWARRFSHTSLVFNNQMWIVGGWDAGVDNCVSGTSACNDVWYSANGTTWTQQTAAAHWVARRSHASLVFNSQMWVIGGFDASIRLNDVWYSVNGTSWTRQTLAAQWTAREAHTPLVFNGNMWVIGGTTGTALNDAWYSANGTTWTQQTAAAHWVARSAHTSSTFNNQMWVMGGLNGSSYYNDIWHTPNSGLFTVNVQPTVAEANETPDPSGLASEVTFTVAWDDSDLYQIPAASDGISESDPNQQGSTATLGAGWVQATAAAQWIRRGVHAGVVFNSSDPSAPGNRMWVMGGLDGSSVYNDVWYATSGAAWTQATAAAQWVARKVLTSAVFNNQMWVLGGVLFDDVTGRNDVWYSANGTTWTQATAAAQWARRWGHSSLVFNNQMWVMGGKDGDVGACVAATTCNDVWYSATGTTWTQATIAAQWIRREGLISLVFNNQMWVMGGLNSANVNDVWYSTSGTTWTQATVGAQWNARSYHASLTFNNQMWVVGGYDANTPAGGCASGTTVCNDVWYSANGTTWTLQTAAAGWVARYVPTTPVFNNQMWVVGGYDISIYRNDVWYALKEGTQARVHICKTNEITSAATGGACASGQTWVSSSASSVDNPQSLVYTSALADEGPNAYWVFVCDDSGASNACSSSTALGQFWTPAAGQQYGPNSQGRGGITWTARYLHASVVFKPSDQTGNSWMWVLGGSSTTLTNDVWYSATGTTWTQATAAAQWVARFLPGSVVFNPSNPLGQSNQLWIIGGQGAASVNRNDVWYSTSGTTWTQATAAAQWTARSSPASLVFNRQMWVIGGCTTGSCTAATNNVWYSVDGTTWTQSTAAAQWVARAWHNSLVFNNQMWVIGGYDAAATYYNDVWYSTSGATWTRATVAAQWSGRSLFDSLVFNNQMWVIGGLDATNHNDVWYTTSGTSWTQQTAAAHWAARRDPGTLVFNNQMWVMGGYDNPNLYNDIWRTPQAALFYVNTSPTVEASDTPDPVVLGSAISFTADWDDLNLYQAPEKGDGISENSLAQEDKYAPGILWTQATGAAQWIRRSGHTSPVFNSQMWVIGGLDSGGTRRNDVWYSDFGAIWTQSTAATQWVGRENHTSLVFNNQMWVIGGITTTYVNDVWYTTSGTSWTQQTAAAHWIGRSLHTSLVFNNQMWVAGGTDGTNLYNDVWYSTAGASWTRQTAGAQWARRYYLTSLVFNNQIWIVGGLDSGSARHNDVWYSATGTTWTQATAGAQWAARYSHTSLVFNNQMWVMGGIAATQVNDVWYSTTGTTWTQSTAAAQWTARNSYTSPVFNNEMWAIGGDDGTTRNDVWYSDRERVNVRLHACKTNVTTSPTTGGGCDTGQLWASSSATFAETDPMSVTYTTATGDESSRGYWLFVCDDMGLSNSCTSTNVGDYWVRSTGGAQVNQSNAYWARRYASSSIVFNSSSLALGASQMWVIGGADASIRYNDVWYSAAGVSWTQSTAAAQWAGRYGQSSFVFNSSTGAQQDQVWVVGGCTAGTCSTARNDVWYSTTGASWTSATAAAQWVARYLHGSNVFNNRMWVMGGYDLSAIRNDVWYSITGTTWTQATVSAHWAARLAIVSPVFNSRMWVMGGGTAVVSYNDVWYSVDGITWTSATAAAQWAARYAPSSLVFNNQMWVMGGCTSADICSARANDVWYSGDGISWTRATASAQWAARYAPSSLVFNNQMWVMGGYDDTNYYNDIWHTPNSGLFYVNTQPRVGVSDTPTEPGVSDTPDPVASGSAVTFTLNWEDANTLAVPAASDGISERDPNQQGATAVLGADWLESTAASHWTLRSGHTSLVFNSQMWVMGGSSDGGTTVRNDVWYTTSGTSWTQSTAASQWTSRYAHASLVFNNQMWVIGGFDGSAYRNDIWYSTAGTIWTQATVSAQWAGRQNHTSLVFNNQMWVVGGTDGTNPYNDVWYSTSGSSWTRSTAASQWIRRYSHTSLVFNNQMWVVGGLQSATSYNDVWYSTSGTTWTQSTSASQWTSRYRHTSLVFNNQMWVMGGDDGANRNDVWYSAAGTTWTQSTAASKWIGRNDHASLVFNNQMWVIGGTTGTARNDAWYSLKEATAVKVFVCKTNSITSASSGGACGGAEWVSSTATTASSPVTLSYTTGAPDVGTNSYWAFACDDSTGTNSCSVAGPGEGNSWEQVTAAAQWAARNAHTSVVFNINESDKRMWVIGGTTGTLANNVWWSANGTSWTQATAGAQWSARDSHTSVDFSAAGEYRMWVIAGDEGAVNLCETGGGTRCNDVWYSAAGTTWTQATVGAHFSARDNHSSIVFQTPGAAGQAMWVIGGTTGTVQNDVWYSVDGISWTSQTAAAQWPARESQSSVVFTVSSESRIWVIGGTTGTVQNDVWYSTSGASWTRATAGAQWLARNSHTSVVYNNQMWVIGGTTGTRQNDAWYSTDGISWTRTTAAAQFIAREEHSSVVFSNRMWVIGGTTGSNQNDVWYASGGTFTVTSTSIDISGTCDQYDQTTDCVDDGAEEIRVAVNGSLQAQAATSFTGVWTITGVTVLSGDTVTVFINSATDGDQAVAVTEYDGSGNIAGMKLYEHHLTTGSDDTGVSISNADMDKYTNVEHADNDVFHGVTTGTLTVDVGNAFTDEELYISDTYAPAGDMNTHDLEIEVTNGTFTGAGNTYRVSGSWDNNNVFTASTSTVIFTSTAAATEIIDSTGASTHSFNLLTLGETSGTTTWDLDSVLDVDSNLLIDWGTLGMSGSNNITLGGNLTINANGNYTSSTGTFTFDGATSPVTWGNAATVDNMGTVLIDGPKTVNIVSVASSTSVRATQLTVTAGDTLAFTSASMTITLTGSGADAARPFVVDGTFTAGATSTVDFTGTTASDIEALSYRNLRLIPAATVTYTLADVASETLTVLGDWTIGDGGSTVTATAATTDPVLDVDGNITIATTDALTASDGGSAFTVGGNWDNNGTFTHSSGRVTFDAADTGNSIQSGGSPFFNVDFDGTGGSEEEWSFTTDAVTIAGDLRMTEGTLNNAVATAVDITVTGDNVTCNVTCGTITLTTAANIFEHRVTGAAAKTFGTTTGSGAWTFVNLKFNNADGAAARTITPNAGTGAINVDETLTLGDSGTQNITLDNEAGDRTFDLDSHFLISTRGVWSASTSAVFTLAGNFTNNGTFTSNSGTVTIDGASPSTSIFTGTATPAITFNNFTCTTQQKTLSFVSDKTFRVNGLLTITGASGNLINVQSDNSITNIGVSWTQQTAAAEWINRYAHTSLVFNNQMWVMGGSPDIGATFRNDVWYSAAGTSWTQATVDAQWAARFGHTSLVFNNQMWVIGGGSSGITRRNDVWYSAAGTTWTQATAAAQWIGSFGHTSLVFNNQMWFIGGCDDPCSALADRRNDVWYSTSGTTWTQATAAAHWIARYIHTSLVFNNQMWVIGGYTGALPIRNDVWYSTTGTTWTQATAAAHWINRYAHTSLVFNNQMWVMGGTPDGVAFRNDVWYSATGTSWTQQTAAAQWAGRELPTSLAFNNQMWVMGGSPDDVATRNDVWYSPGNQWLINHQGTENVQYANITRSGCALGTTNISLDGSSTDGGINGPCWLFPSLSFRMSATSVAFDLSGDLTDEQIVDLVVTSNATNGYEITTFRSGTFANQQYPSESIADFGGTNASPDDWESNCSSGAAFCGWGYSTDDDTLRGGTADRFTVPAAPCGGGSPRCYAAFTATGPGDPVADAASTVDDDLTRIRLKTSVSSTQAAGTYAGTVVFVLTTTW